MFNLEDIKIPDELNHHDMRVFAVLATKYDGCIIAWARRCAWTPNEWEYGTHRLLRDDMSWHSGHYQLESAMDAYNDMHSRCCPHTAEFE